MINKNILLEMLTSEDPNDVALALPMAKKFYKGTDRNILSLIDFYNRIDKMYSEERINGEWVNVSLPLSLTQKGLQFNYSNIIQLPDNLKIMGNLSLYRCKGFKKLPKNLYVEGSLNIIGTKIKEIPKDCVYNNLISDKTDKEEVKFINVYGLRIK